MKTNNTIYDWRVLKGIIYPSFFQNNKIIGKNWCKPLLPMICSSEKVHLYFIFNVWVNREILAIMHR